MLDAVTDRDYAPGSSPSQPECSAFGHASSRGSQGDGGVEQSVGERDAHGNYYQAQGPGRPVTFSTADQWDAEQRAETYRRTYGIRVNGVNTAWTRWTWAGEHKVFEVWGAMTEREWNAAVLADPTPLPVYRVSPDIVDDGGTDSYFNPGLRARRDTAPTVRETERLTIKEIAAQRWSDLADASGSVR